MTANTNYKSICSVAVLAKKLGLSRARFYQLQKIGVFPTPVYCLYTKRPFYPMDLQEKCLEIRRTGIGYNERPIIFYSKKDIGVKRPKICPEQKFIELSDALGQMGLKVSPAKAEIAIMECYPNNWKTLVIEGDLIAEMFRYLRNGV